MALRWGVRGGGEGCSCLASAGEYHEKAQLLGFKHYFISIKVTFNLPRPHRSNQRKSSIELNKSHKRHAIAVFG